MYRLLRQGLAGVADVIVIGAGHSGLAMSYRLSQLGVEHVVLERGEVANAWRTERWDSLRLLTPKWLTRLPGHAYVGNDPHGYMTMAEVTGFIERYAMKCDAPVHTGTSVTRVECCGAGYRVDTDKGAWLARAVVLATGAFNIPNVPGLAEGVPADVQQVTAKDYRRPEQLADGGVLVVGASATGLQLAEEIHASGRPVTLAVGEHVRVPRRYRGRDILYWMLEMGLYDQGIDDVDDPLRVARLPSPQLAGTPDHSTLDLNALTAKGVRLVGRLAGMREGRAQFSGGLRNVCELADLKMNRLLRSIDAWIDAQGLAGEAGPVEEYAPTLVEATPALEVDLAAGEISTIVWATGFRPDYSWLHAKAFDARGRLRHTGGVIDVAGLYVLGLPFLRKRKSSFIHGAGDDVEALSSHLSMYLDETARFGPSAA